MGEQKYRLEENNHTNELILWENEKIINVFKNSYDNRKHLNIIVGRLNEQQATINKLEQENRQLRQFINKGRRLSVKELMANTNENELLKKKIKELEKENKELQKDKNKNEMIDNE